MMCEHHEELMMGYLDGELEEELKRVFEEHLAACPECASELEEFRRLKAITEGVTLVEPEDRVWQQYWDGIYNRIERGIGWILLSVTGIAFFIYASFKGVEGIIKDPTIEVALKVALLAFIAGIAILFVSVLRERMYFWKRDRYKDVRR